LNYFHDTLFYLIENKYSYDIIKFFIECSIDNMELLIYSVEYSEFEIAKLLLKYGTRIDNKFASKNIIGFEKRKPNLYRLLFILRVKKDASLITYEVLCELLRFNKNGILEKLFKHKFYDETFILNMLFSYIRITELFQK